MKRTIVSLLVLVFSMVLCNSCGEKSAVKPESSGGMPPEKEFIGVGIGKEVQDARNNAYVDLVRKGIEFIVGDSAYQKNQDSLERSFLTYKLSRKFILGETEETSADKQKKWVGQSKDNDNNSVFQLRGWVNLKKLKTEIDLIGIKY